MATAAAPAVEPIEMKGALAEMLHEALDDADAAIARRRASTVGPVRSWDWEGSEAAREEERVAEMKIVVLVRIAAGRPYPT